MQLTLAFSALLMGVVGGPHCVAMCGAACAGLGQAAGEQRQKIALFLFQTGRVVGYALLGGLAAASVQGLGWLAVHSAALRPVWSLFHVATLLFGLMLFWQGRQPLWVDGLGRKIWILARRVGAAQGAFPLLLGILWALLPCGLLYSALLVAAMAGSVLSGAGVMALFALGTSLTMTLAPWLWLKLCSSDGTIIQKYRNGQWGVRLAGVLLAANACWALWISLMHNAAPWCAV